MRSRVVPILFALAVIGLTLSTAPVASAVPADLKVATYNVFLFSRTIYPNWGQQTRADLIDSQGVLDGQDVVVLQEAFDNGSSDRLLASLADTYPHQTPVMGRSRSGWDATMGSYSDTVVEDGGVAVISRWPIAEQIQYVYKDACGADFHANKGFVYVRLNSPAGPVHVIGTHMQADDTGCSQGEVSVRAKQIAEIAGFVRSKNIPANETVVVAGDLNIDRHSGEFGEALRALGARAPEVTSGHPYSFDPQTNSITADRYPDHARQQLDHVLLLSGHAGPSRWGNETRMVHSPKWTVTSWGKEYSYTDYSDHYPVFATAAR
ncbi:sphingomyelin phosphodiesterase [Longimycelium tulufanense]|uniref:Sphingomyelin phosphodiesterase n=1 Tax=Longimycelium tulufanense TaxID=907463 RepID=A0A8J3CB79_9PSEU|nr:sphingomyelin phosphodiesterase [Longimycelium tulufanense]GGM43428.1 sphingomyelin phosphodiesterase [Longimycelium tulufanense]